MIWKIEMKNKKKKKKKVGKPIRINEITSVKRKLKMNP